MVHSSGVYSLWSEDVSGEERAAWHWVRAQRMPVPQARIRATRPACVPTTDAGNPAALWDEERTLIISAERKNRKPFTCFQSNMYVRP